MKKTSFIQLSALLIPFISTPTHALTFDPRGLAIKLPITIDISQFVIERCGIAQPVSYPRPLLLFPNQSSAINGLTWQSCTGPKIAGKTIEYFKVTNNTNECQINWASFAIHTPHMPSTLTGTSFFKFSNYTAKNSIITTPVSIPRGGSVNVYATSDTGHLISIPLQDAQAVRSVYLTDKSTALQVYEQFDDVSTSLVLKDRYLMDANCNKVMMRGVNVAPYKEGWLDDIDAVSAAVKTTQANTVRLQWWTHIPGSPEPQNDNDIKYYTPADLDRAITAFSSKGILPIVTLHDLTPDINKGSNIPNSQQFNNIITAFWTQKDIVDVINKHQAHLIINIANEWGPNWDSNNNQDSQTDISNFINTYKSAITALRAKNIKVPLMIDADHWADNEQIFISNSYDNSSTKSNGQRLIDADPLHNIMFSVHTYFWEGSGESNARLDALVSSKLPFIIGEMGNILPKPFGNTPSGYDSFLTEANNRNIGYLAWNWYNDGTPSDIAPHHMNITMNGTHNDNTGDGYTLPTTRDQNPWGWDILNAPGYGINTALPANKPIAFK